MEFLMAAAAPQQQNGGNLFMNFLPFILIIVVLYIFFFLPIKRKQKAHQEMLETLARGDRIVTSGGIIGTISSINKDKGFVIIKLVEGAKAEVRLSNIADKITE